MLNEEIKDKIRNTLNACDAHDTRMKYAVSKLYHLFPLTTSSFLDLDDNLVSITDQLILRFLKLQDSVGQKLFPQLLLALGEDYSDRPMIDILNRLEQLRILESTEEWMVMREVRNLVTHDYPHLVEEMVEGLNQLSIKAMELSSLYGKVRDYIHSKT